MDLEKLIKILNLTTSDSDGEALAAIRTANSLLKKSGKTWEDMFKAVPKPEKPYRWNTAPMKFSPSFFTQIMECKDFTSSLNQDAIDWLNKVIRFYNKHKFLPEDAWMNVRDLWHVFREKDR
jgi:hypothetical protein